MKNTLLSIAAVAITRLIQEGCSKNYSNADETVGLVNATES